MEAKATEYRARAGELRAIAATAQDAYIKKMLLGLARDYERTAHLLFPLPEAPTKPTKLRDRPSR